MKRLKKLMAILLAFVLCVTSGGLYVDSYASDASVSGEVSTVGGAYISYEMNNTEQGDAEGTISFHFEDLAQDSVTSIKYYWVNANGEKLDNYYHIAEFSDSYLSPVSTSNTVADAANGFKLHKGAVIPYGAAGLVADVTYTTSDGTSASVTINKCKYVTTVGDVAVSDSTLPVYKLSTVDYLTDINGEETYQMFYLSDFHDYYGWSDTEETATYKTTSTVYVSSDGKTKGSPQGKALYGIGQIVAEDSKTVGLITTGDIVDDASGGTGSKGKATEKGYDAILATYYQAGMLGKYLNIFANGNHDLIKAYVTEENNSFVGFLEKAYLENATLVESDSLPATVTGLSSPSDYYYDFYIGEDHYIVLGSPYESGSYGETQIAWFGEKIAKDNTDGVRTFVISHEPMMDTGIYATSEYMSDAPQLKALIEENSSNHETVWFSGHTHVYYNDNIQNVSIEHSENVSYVGLPSTMDTGLRSKKIEAQGMQVKVYEDKIVMIGRVLYSDGAYKTYAMPSAMYVIDYAEADATIPTVTIDESAAVDNVLEIGSSVTPSISTNDATGYQWYVGGTAIEGATDATYTITEDTPAGRLSVAVTTASGTYYGIVTAKVVGTVIHIGSSKQLARIGVDVEYPLDGNYVLDCDIDLSSYEKWTPIGYAGGATKAWASDTLQVSNVFSGTFDGSGYTISGMQADNDDQTYNYVGLFGVVGGAAEIKNIHFKDCAVVAKSGTAAFAGIVAGAMYPTSKSMDAGAKVTNISIEDCAVTATSRNLNNQTMAGSIVGEATYVTLQDIWSNANVVAMYDHTTEEHSKQIIAGGIIGGSYVPGSGGNLSLTNCVFAGMLDASDHYEGDAYACTETCAYERTGAMLGANTRGVGGTTAYTPNVTNSNCYYASDSANVNSYNQNAFNGTAMTSSELKNALSSTHMDSSTKWYNDAEDGLKLVIGREFDATNFADYIVLWDADDLATINDNLAGKYVLAQDVNMAGYGNWTPIGDYNVNASNAKSGTNNFTGIFNGNGKTIKGMTVDVSSTYVNAGLFGTVYGATIKNVVFDGCTVTARATNRVYAAIVVGSAWDTAVNVDNVLVRNSAVHVETTNSGQNAAAASFVGVAAPATITNCWSDAAITAEYTGTSYSNQIGVGGFVGTAYKTVIAKKSVFAGTLDASQYYADGQKPDTDYLHQNIVLGFNNQGINETTCSWGTKTVENCYYLDSVAVSSNYRGVSATALSTVDFGIRSTDTLGLDSTYWIHTGYKPVLAISGETAWDGTPDVNEDGIVDICDLVRNKVFEEDNTIENVLYRATNMAEATTDDAVAVDSNDIVQMRTYLLENVDIYLDQTTASNFKLLGNTVANANEFYMDYSYTGFSFEAYATGDVDVDFRYISQNAFPYAKIAVIVDGDVENREVIEIAADGTYTIATVEAGYHTFEVVKLTERTHDILKADKLSFKGILKSAPADAELNIQFIGDSITAASALDSYTKGNSAEEQAVQDILQGYAYQTATLLDADLSVRARSGIKTAAAATALLPENATNEYDIVVIGLGTNDNTAGDADKQATLKADVTTMLTNARATYPNAKIVWIYGMMIAVDNDTIKAAVDEFNATDGNVYYFDGFTANQEGGAGHPDAAAHTEAAEALAAYINSL